MKFQYDLIVLGGGAGGFVSALFAVGLGKKVLVIEKKHLGGECTHSGCVPSKSLLKAAHKIHDIKSISKFGIQANISDINTDGALSYTRDIISNVYEEHTADKLEAQGVDVVMGAASFKDYHTIEVNGKNYTSSKFMITTGSSPVVPPVAGFENIDYLTNETIFKLEKIPVSMLIIGAGPIGIEMAVAFNRLGSKVTVIERGNGILPRDDYELVEILRKCLEEEGIIFKTCISVLKAEQNGHVVSLTLETEKGNEILTSEKVLAATGRKANVGGLDLDSVQVKYTQRGIEVDNTMRTSVKNIYACGDVTGSFQFSHMAEYGAKTAIINAFFPIKKTTDYSSVPWCTFSDPELAHTGMLEKEAVEKYGKNNIYIYRYNFSNMDRAKTESNTIGMSKIITDKKGYIIGASILGERAGEIIHTIQYLKSLKIPLYKAYQVIHIYPTYMDVIKMPARDSYLDKINNNILVKVLKMLKGK